MDHFETFEPIECPQVASLRGQHMCIVICGEAAASEATMNLTNALRPHLVQLVTGPFHTSKLDELLLRRSDGSARDRFELRREGKGLPSTAFYCLLNVSADSVASSFNAHRDHNEIGTLRVMPGTSLTIARRL